MNKTILYILTLCCLPLLVISCDNNDEATQPTEVQADHAKIAVAFPADFDTESAAAILADGYQLRVILEAYAQDNLEQRQEITATTIEQLRNLAFNIPMETGNYNLLLWVDYVKAAQPTTDLYYNTTNLKQVALIGANALPNQPAVAAFCYSGVIEKQTGIGLSTQVTLIRPFTQVSLHEKDPEALSHLQAYTVEYQMPTRYNVATATASDIKETNYTHSTFEYNESDDGIFFTTYVFTDTNSTTLGVLTVDFTTDAEVENQYQVTVPDIITLVQGKHTVVSAFMLKPYEEPLPDFEIIFDIEVADWNSTVITIEPVDPADLPLEVGQFLLADGTASDEWSEEPEVIGIVFATGTDKTDQSDYGAAFKEKSIAGYAFALTNAGKRKRILDKGNALNINTKVTESWQEGDYSGYAYTQEMITAIEKDGMTEGDYFYPGYTAWMTEHAIDTNVTNLSSWYTPSTTQLEDFIDAALGSKEAVKNAYLIAVENGAQRLTADVNGSGVVNFLASSMPAANKIAFITVTTNKAKPTPTETFTKGEDTPGNKQILARPVITIFK